MNFSVCGITAEIEDDVVNHFLKEEKYYTLGPDKSIPNTFDAAVKSKLHQNYTPLCETEDYILFGAKYNRGFKLFMFDLVSKNPRKIPNNHQNSKIIASFDTLRLE